MCVPSPDNARTSSWARGVGVARTTTAAIVTAARVPRPNTYMGGVPLLEVPVDADLREPGLNDLRRHAPDSGARIVAVLADNGIGVQRVVKVEADRRPCATVPQNLSNPEVELV